MEKFFWALVRSFLIDLIPDDMIREETRRNAMDKVYDIGMTRLPAELLN